MIYFIPFYHNISQVFILCYHVQFKNVVFDLSIWGIMKFYINKIYMSEQNHEILQNRRILKLIVL